MILLSFVFGLCKVLNDCSAEQETVGGTLRMTATFSKLQRALSPKKNWLRQYLYIYIYTYIYLYIIYVYIYIYIYIYIFMQHIYIYTEITQAISFHTLYNCCIIVAEIT